MMIYIYVCANAKFVCAGAELYFTSVQSRDAGVYICTCQDQRGTNRSHAEIVVTSVYGYHCHIKRKIFFLMLPVKEHQIYTVTQLWFDKH